MNIPLDLSGSTYEDFKPFVEKKVLAEELQDDNQDWLREQESWLEHYEARNLDNIAETGRWMSYE